MSMVAHVLSSLLTLFLSFHTQLYHPDFGQIPAVLAATDEVPSLTLTSATFGYLRPPSIQAQAAYVIENHSGEIVFAQNASMRLFPASTTKIMTALIAIENYDLNATASVSGHLAHDGSTMGLVAGEQIKIADLLAGLLIPSANDAADQMAKLFPNGEAAFIERMNERAKELGLQDTHYTNSIGYSDPGHVTSVRDLAILAREAMKHPEFRALVSVQNKTVYSTDGTIQHRLKSTNELLGKLDGIEGIKTGWTEEAGECFVSQTTRGGQTFTTVVLKSPDRFGETKKLVDWAFTSFHTETKTLGEWNTE